MAKEFSITRNNSGEVVLLIHGAHYDKRITIDEDARYELVDALCSGCDLLKDEMARADRLALTTRPATLQAPDPAMTLGAAAEPDAPLLGVLLPDGKWAELATGQLHAGYNPHLAQAVADNHGGTVRAFNEGRGDE